MIAQFFRKKWPFRVSIASLVIGLVMALSAAQLWVSRHESARGALASAKTLFTVISARLIEQTSGLLFSVAVLTDSGSRLASLYDTSTQDGVDPRLLEFMLRTLEHNPYIHALSISRRDGTLFEVVASRGNIALLQAYGAPRSTRYIVRSVTVRDGLPVLRQSCRDRDLQILSSQEIRDQELVQRIIAAHPLPMETPSFHCGQPGILPVVKLPGISCQQADPNLESVFRVDLTLNNFADFFWNQEISPHGSAFLFDRNQLLLVHPREPVVSVVKKGKEEEIWYLSLAQSTRPEVRAVGELFTQQGEGALNREQILEADGQPHLLRLTAMAHGGFNPVLAVLAPIDDFTGHIRTMQYRTLVLSCLVLIVAILSALQLARRVTNSLSRLAHQADSVQRLDFSEPSPAVRSRFIEIHSLIESFTLMRHTVRDRTGQLLDAQRDLQRLLDAFIQVLAGAIDAKSPHTGRHCSRVPELAEILAREADQVEQGPLASFRLEGEEQWREFRIAAWLHDCGKVTTPEYVADKGAKLETLYNRIHEIRLRFEIIWRDLEIACLKEIMNDPRKMDDARTVLAAEQQRLREQFALVARCNLGGESMPEETRSRLMEIATRTWQRHFDDSLGLSAEETARYHTAYPQGSPRQQALLADQPWHIVPHTGRLPLNGHQPPFRLQRPACRCNLGELHNLLVSKGTLTPEERFLIQEHCIQTILMLEQLPFPAQLANVPRYAGAHHERLDGSGYPLGLTAQGIPTPARILAIADVFEALTACDRPYKEAMPVTQAFAVMESMAGRSHLDPTLLALFREPRVWLPYARRYLRPEQFDETAPTPAVHP